ncbi:M14 family metallocarboxypeptidase [uncultured Shewanella sp.]|uniref:M14 family metallopeptidase n=1 Tax=uncultured Shewanella sp. TaxID=173975 RepID=UPI00262D7E43|nr:M14 family metallocarboxypeptidase [uncultured Shewanella sp.]
MDTLLPKWGLKEKNDWLATQAIKRSYHEQVINQIHALDKQFTIKQYGALSYDAARYPLYVITTPDWHKNKPILLITGGVHGYETSGVQGALAFLKQEALNYIDAFNIIVAPCISPWGYETINRWNPHAVDPNRSFYPAANTPGINHEAEESRLLMQYLAGIEQPILMHIDLHETTNTDNTVFRPALAARDATPQKTWNIPDGFYLVGDSNNPQDAFQKTIIDAVQHVTHIAPADSENRLIGEPLSQFGVINYPTQALGLCSSVTNAQYTSTTEVYPDSPNVTDAICVQAQVTAIKAGIDYLINNHVSNSTNIQ